MNKRVLIVGYYYVDAGMGGTRLRRIARLLPKFGWEAVVLTHPPDLGSRQETLHLVRTIEAPAPDLAQLYAKLRPRRRQHRNPSVGGEKKAPAAMAIGLTSALNRWLMVPDKQITWYASAVRHGLEALRTEKFDAIFASLDPRTSLLVASRLSKETGVPCILEYRDLWVGNPYYHVAQATPLHRAIHRALERRVVRQATRISAVCRGIADGLGRTYPELLRNPIALNYNFFDPEEYPSPSPSSPGVRPFTITYTGAFYTTRSPRPFFEGLRLFLDRTKLTPAEFQFRWAGHISGIHGLDEAIDGPGVRPYLEFLGQLPHREALRLLVDGDASLLIQAPEDAIHIPGKLFEAMGARVPLLAVSNPSETAEIIDECHAGVVCAHTAAKVADGLTRLFEFSRSSRPWEFREDKLTKYSAETCVRQLAALFEAVQS